MKFRASYSVLRLWATGMPDMQEEAIKRYFKMPVEKKDYLEAGKELHQQWEQEVNRGFLPKEFGERKLGRCFAEKKIEVSLAPWLDLVGVIDLAEFVEELEGWELTDFKSGDGGFGFYHQFSGNEKIATSLPIDHFTSGSHLSKPQLGIYVALFLSHLKQEGLEEKVKRVRILHLNQSTGVVDSSYRWVTQKLVDDAIDFVVAFSSDMHDYLKTNKVYDDPYKFFGMVAP